MARTQNIFFQDNFVWKTSSPKANQIPVIKLLSETVSSMIGHRQQIHWSFNLCPQKLGRGTFWVCDIPVEKYGITVWFWQFVGANAFAMEGLYFRATALPQIDSLFFTFLPCGFHVCTLRFAACAAVLCNHPCLRSFYWRHLALRQMHAITVYPSICD